jgi:type I restriction enzyme, S subunit
MSAYRPYPKYKPSGVEWLGDVPEEWVVSRIKNVATINASKSEVSHLDPETEISFLPMEAVGDDGSLDSSTTRQLGDVLTGYTYVRENDVLVAKITPCFENGKGCIARGLNNGIGFATTEVVPIRPNKRSLPEFLYSLLHGLPFRKVAEGSMYGAGGQKRVSDTFVAGYSFALPPLSEQIQIAAFLDRECGKLDALQAKQERLIELLKEKRQALISHAVTRGLDPAAPLKPSGIEWLGEVPEHWVVSRVKFVLINEDRMRIPLSSEERSHKQGEFPYYGASGIIDSIDEYIFEGDRILVGEDGANLVNRATPLAFVASGKYWVNNHAHILRAPDELSVFWAELIETNDISAIVSGSAQPKLTAENLANLPIWFPPSRDEREEIVAHLDEKCGKIDRLKAKAERGIELLKERRSALISAAVTGKIDVRNS